MKEKKEKNSDEQSSEKMKENSGKNFHPPPKNVMDKILDRIIRVPLETIPTTFYAIFRNKRRSLAMLSGIVLAMSLLSGVILYNDELKEDNYRSMVSNNPFEISFNIIGNESLESMQYLANTIESDYTKASDTIILCSGSSNQQNTELNGDLYPEASDSNETPSIGYEFQPRFVENNFYVGEIGQRIFEDIQGNSTLRNDTVIVPQTFLQMIDLEIGDQIELVNLTLRHYYQDENDDFAIDDYRDRKSVV